MLNIILLSFPDSINTIITSVCSHVCVHVCSHMVSHVVSHVVSRVRDHHQEGCRGLPCVRRSARESAKAVLVIIICCRLSLRGLSVCSHVCAHDLYAIIPVVSQVLKQKRRPDRTSFLSKTPSVFRTFSTDNPSFYSRFHASPQPYILLQFGKTSRSPAVQKEILSHNSK